jgi:recombination protein RecR
MYSPSIQKLIQALKRLPSVGERTAERFVFHFLKSGKKEVTELMLALKEVTETVRSCEVCWNFSDTSPCHICNNPKRDQQTICVVTDPPDLQVVERTGSFAGVYHILRGALDPGDDDSFNRTKTTELLERITKQKPKEVILALNPDLAGETTMLYIEKELKATSPDTTVTRLARGLPLGGDLRYADDITLTSAFKYRVKR